MRTSLAGCAALLLLLCGQLAAPVITYASPCQSIFVPAYSYPGPTTFWDTMIASKPPVSIMVANVSNGPGTHFDRNYSNIIAKARTAGVQIYGYVYTQYGARQSSKVTADINAWKSLYGVSNIFVDQVSTHASDEVYYQGVAAHIRATSGAAVMLNPGAVPDQGYMNIGDIVVTFEGNQSDYYKFSQPSWVATYPASRFAHIVYGVADSASMLSVLSISQTFNTGNVYITDDGQVNPFDTVPSYWPTETSQINTNCAPAHAATTSSSGGTSGAATPKTYPASTVTSSGTTGTAHGHAHAGKKTAIAMTTAGHKSTVATKAKVVIPAVGVVALIAVGVIELTLHLRRTGHHKKLKSIWS